MALEIKSVSFGGYDKGATETYVLEQQKKYEDEINKLRADAAKLSEAVKGLQQMREANMAESKSTIDELSTANEEMRAELDKLRTDLENYKAREIESASRYESISRTLLAARENADQLTKRTNDECEAKMAETTAQCKAMLDETNARCEQLKNATEAECDRLLSQTQSSCQEQKETTYAECESLKRKTKEETDALSLETETRCSQLTRETEERCDNLSAQTESACARLKEDTIAECDKAKAETREEIRQNRFLVKREFDSVGGFMAQLQVALADVTSAVNDAKKLTDSAFSDLNTSSSAASEPEAASNEESTTY